MPLTPEFFTYVRDLFVPGMGTENLAPLLYSMVRMLRPRRVLEVGLGYTTPFLAEALRDAKREWDDDQLLLCRQQGGSRAAILDPDHYLQPYEPRLMAIDDESFELSSAPRVGRVLNLLGLDDLVDSIDGDFRDVASKVPAPVDLVWYDCGGLDDYVDFIAEYWPLVNDDGGVLLLHFTYWTIQSTFEGEQVSALVSGPVVNEMKRQQLRAGIDAHFEIATLVEPHKNQQGSLTMVRKLGPVSMCRDVDFQEQVRSLLGRRVRPFPAL